jgi:DNA-binding MarR family transcriptional regulator
MKQQKTTSNAYLTDYGMWIYIDHARFAVYRLRELELAPYGLTVEQNSVLTVLINEGGSATTKKIEEITLKQHHSISTLINRMIKINCVAKQKSTSGKGYEFYITKEGRALNKKVPVTSLEMVFSALNIEEKKQLSRLLDIVFEKTRNILGLSYTPPFKQYFVKAGKEKANSPEDLSEQILTGYKLWSALIRTAFTVYRLRELELAQYDRTPEQIALLNLLVHDGGSTSTRKIEEVTMRQHHSISTLINRMIKSGYLTKEKSNIGRGFDIAITKEGHNVFKKTPAVSFQMVFSVLTVEERRQLAHLLILILVKAREFLGLATPFARYDSQE